MAAAILAAALAALPEPAAAQLRFDVTLPAASAEAMRRLGLEVPAHGRLFVIVTRDGSSEPRRQVDVTGAPFWVRDVEGLALGASVTLAPGDSAVTGYPLDRLDELPPGDYHVQAFLNAYTTFRRADGHVLRMHADAGEGQNPWISPGNAHSRPVRMRLDPAARGTVALALTEVIQPIEPLRPGEVLQQGNPRDTERVRFVKIRSALVSEFWGRDMYIGANVLLPRGWEDEPEARYPVVYLEGHFPGRAAPFGFGRTGGRAREAGFTEFWLSDGAPRVIVVSIRDANPYYDTSYAVNSANVGPYGDAIVQELIPYVEERFRAIGEPWARVVAGGSTGGWEALALQVWHPDFFGGAWGWCPDPVDFHYYQIVNIYDDDNAYYAGEPLHRVERPSARHPDGNIRYTMRQDGHFERAVGPDSRSGGQWAIWEAVFGPVGENGYPRPIWDHYTGAIDRDVAAYWRANFDITHRLRTQWATLGPKLTGKLHVAIGDMDTFYLEEAVYLMEDALRGLKDPDPAATFEYGRRQPHCWIGASRERPGEPLSYAEFVRIAARYMAERAPAGTPTPWLGR
jgi:hypothetical protein